MLTSKHSTHCDNYTPMQNQGVQLYFDAMSPKINKPPQCRNCTYYTSHNCQVGDLSTQINGINFIC